MIQTITRGAALLACIGGWADSAVFAHPRLTPVAGLRPDGLEPLATRPSGGASPGLPGRLGRGQELDAAKFLSTVLGLRMVDGPGEAK